MERALNKDAQGEAPQTECLGCLSSAAQHKQDAQHKQEKPKDCPNTIQASTPAQQPPNQPTSNLQPLYDKAQEQSLPGEEKKAEHEQKPEQKEKDELQSKDQVQSKDKKKEDRSDVTVSKYSETCISQCSDEEEKAYMKLKRTIPEFISTTTNRCFSCDRKTHLLGVCCSFCGLNHCNAHRLPEDHGCQNSHLINCRKRLKTSLLQGKITKKHKGKLQEI